MSPKAGWLLVNRIVPGLSRLFPVAAPRLVQKPPKSWSKMPSLWPHACSVWVSMAKRSSLSGISPIYTIQHSKSGRRSVGNSTADVHGTGTQINGLVRLESSDEAVRTDESTGDNLTLGEVLSFEAEDPSMTAARNLDWQEFIAAQTSLGQAILQALSEGGRLLGLAKKLKISVAAIKAQTQQLAASLLEFMGADILKEIVRKAPWQDNLDATREGLACRAHRN